ncbi:MAG: hypothetical protein JSV03_08915 [Planctomycetota bacterium]|nr:MAG: hypothetical protein JSV03_08915 [Planctomycetota bacterium]
MLYAILRTTFEEMCKEIERSYRFVAGRLPAVATGPLYLIGGGARLKGLPEVLSKLLDTEVRLPDPKRILGTTVFPNCLEDHPACTAANFPVLAACIGLAMKEVSP